MIAFFDNFNGWKVLEFFLENNEKIHVRGLARKIKISVSNAQKYLVAFEKQGLLEKQLISNSIFYSLKENALTFELRKTLFISKISSQINNFTVNNQSISKLVVFGSSAKGTYDNKSDVDLLAISPIKQLKLDALKKLENALSKEIKLQVYSIAEWQTLIKKHDDFAFSVIRNNILLYGDAL